MNRGCLIGCSCISCLTLAIGALALYQLSRELSPSHIVIHNTGHEPLTVEFDSSGASQVDNPGQTVSLSPVYYGQQLPRIKFSDGKTLWLKYFMTDAERVGDVDIFISRIPRAKTADVKCITRRRPAILRHADIDFDGAIEISKTSGHSPALLKGV